MFLRVIVQHLKSTTSFLSIFFNYNFYKIFLHNGMLYFILILVFVLFEIPLKIFIMNVRDLIKIYYLSPNIGDIFYS